MSEETKEFGLAIWRQTARYGSNQEVIVHVMQRDQQRSDCPKGTHWEAWKDEPLFEDLEMKAWVSTDEHRSDRDPYVYLTHPEYRDVHSVGAGRAKAMASLLLKFEKARRAADASDYGDVFAVFAKVVGAKFVCVPKGGGDRPHQLSNRASSWSDTTWIWWTPSEGRNIFRGLIQNALDSEKERRGIKVAA